MKTLFLLSLLLGCGGDAPGTDAPTFPGAALLTTSSPDGAWSFELRSDPQLLMRGVVSIQYRVKSPDGGVPSGMKVLPWMPAMGHGTSVTPTVKDEGGGVFTVTHVNFYMPGLWELRTHVEGTAPDDVAPQFQIP